jgi:zinc protease
MLKQANEDAKKNGHWTNILSEYAKYGIDFQTDYKKTVEALTAEKISAFIKNVILKDNNHMEVIMMPEETKTETTK